MWNAWFACEGHSGETALRIVLVDRIVIENCCFADCAGAHRVAADSVLTVAPGYGPGKADQAVLRSGIRGASHTPAGACNRGDVDDRPPSDCGHQRNDRARQHERGSQIDGNDPVPQLVRGPVRRAQIIEDAGTVYEDIDVFPPVRYLADR